MDKKRILEILEGAKDDNGEIPMSLVRKAFEKIEEPCTDAVSRQAAIRIAEQGQIQGFEWQIKKLLGMPSAQPERKMGKWIWECSAHRCSACSEYTCFAESNPPKYCPNCGADMRGEEE